MSKTMPTQKTFKRSVRARMTKTGESYTAARHQLLRKSGEPDPADTAVPAQATEAVDAAPAPTTAFGVSDEAMQRATGKPHGDWFVLLDAWGATARTHTEIATWLRDAEGVPPWWTQSVTVAYERARGMRSRHQMADGFSVGATRTVAVDPDRALAAFTDAAVRRQWLPDADMRQRPTKASLSVRFDWPEPPSRIVVTMVPKGAGKTTVGVSHEQLPDAKVAERLKVAWRGWLGALKEHLERS
jgi:uncharacterized protein YndB with AHSA1/START domain